MQDNMTPEQALKLVDDVFAKFNGTRADHYALQTATQVLQKLVGDSKASEKEKKAAKS